MIISVGVLAYSLRQSNADSSLNLASFSSERRQDHVVMFVGCDVCPLRLSKGLLKPILTYLLTVFLNGPHTRQNGDFRCRTRCYR